MDTQERWERRRLAAWLAIAEVFGDSAWNEVWEQFYPRQREYLLKLGGKLGFRPDQIEDVMQDVFVEMLGLWEEWWPDKVHEWLDLFGPRLKSRLVDETRRNGQRRAESLETLPEEPRSRGPSDDAFRVRTEELRELLETLLKELGPEYEENRVLVIAHYLEGRSCEELAAATGHTAHAIECRITRTLKALRRLAKKHPACDGLIP